MFAALKKLFHHKSSNQETLWGTVTHTLAVTIELYPLTTDVLGHLLHNLNLQKGAFVLIEDQNIYDIISVGFQNRLSITFDQLAYFLKFRHVLPRTEVKEQDIKLLLDSLEINLVRVLQVEQKIVGLLILGGDSPSKSYSPEQISLLDDLCEEISVAVSNARSYDKIKQFNITLSQAVKQATAELEQTNAKLKELDKAKDDFVSIASHELRTPMTAIRSYAWMALHKSDMQLTDKMERYLSRIFISTERSIDLVGDLLSVSRLESGHMMFHYSSFDLVNLLHDVLEELHPKIITKELDIKLIPSQVPAVYGDPEKVQQIYSNLLSNAIKYTPAHGTIEISFFCDGVTVEVSIKDSGVGINREDVPRLFAKFGRLDNSLVASATSGGTGLGLYISKTIVEQMNGSIRVNSEGLGKGATFSFSLPVTTETMLSQAGKYVPITPKEVSLLHPQGLVR